MPLRFFFSQGRFLFLFVKNLLKNDLSRFIMCKSVYIIRYICFGREFMYYEEFTEDVRERVEELIQEEIPECIVTVRNVVKNNSVRRKALSFVVKDEKATPTIYLREFYEDYKEGRFIDDICEEIIDTYKRGLNRFKK